MAPSRYPADERVRFGRHLDAVCNAYLQEAAASVQSDRAAALLNKAARRAPDALAVDVARYKFYFYRGDLAEAERIVRTALAKAATQGGFEPDWRRGREALAGRGDTDGPQRYYLYALKALAFIRLRRGAAEEALSILQGLQALDPGDLVGSSVIAEIAAGLTD